MSSSTDSRTSGIFGTLRYNPLFAGHRSYASEAATTGGPLIAVHLGTLKTSMSLGLPVAEAAVHRHSTFIFPGTLGNSSGWGSGLSCQAIRETQFGGAAVRTLPAKRGSEPTCFPMCGAIAMTPEAGGHSNLRTAGTAAHHSPPPPPGGHRAGRLLPGPQRGGRLLPAPPRRR